MAKSYRPVRREQEFLLPPDPRDWLSEGHLVWQLVDIVEQLDTSMFHGRRSRRSTAGSRAGQPGFDPDVLVVVLLYAYCCGVRSSRAIERACRTDVAFIVACGMDVPDHTVISRFRAEHEAGFVEFFSRVLGLCAEAGMVRVGVVALDGTKIKANASRERNRSESTLRKMAAEIVADAVEIDEAEDRAGNDDEGEPPASMATRARRRETIRAALASIDAEHDDPRGRNDKVTAERVRKAKVKLEQITQQLQDRWQAEQEVIAAGLPRTGRRVLPPEQHWKVARARRQVAAAEASRAKKRAAESPRRRNLTDVESRLMKTRHGFAQAYNAQTIVSEDHVIICCQATNDPVDMVQFEPMLAACDRELGLLAAAGHDRSIGLLLADAGYLTIKNLTLPGPDRLIAVEKDRHQRQSLPADPLSEAPDPAPATIENPIHNMRQRLQTPEARAAYRQRSGIVEPVNGHLKQRRGLTEFMRRGLAACNAELHLAATATNLMRFFTVQAATA